MIELKNDEIVKIIGTIGALITAGVVISIMNTWIYMNDLITELIVIVK